MKLVDILIADRATPECFWVLVQREGLKMFQARSIPAEHKDLIHDVAYDFHGRRMATCSSDQFVKVSKWRLDSILVQ